MGKTIFLLAISIMLCAAPARAEVTIGFVDIPFLIDKAPQALEAAGRLEAEFAPRQTAIQELRTSLKQLKNELDVQSAKQEEAETVELQRQVQKLERQIRRDEKEFREQLNIRKNTEFKKIRLLVLDTISEFGKSGRFDLIVSDGVLYANETVDITASILDVLRKRNDEGRTPNRQ